MENLTCSADPDSGIFSCENACDIPAAFQLLGNYPSQRRKEIEFANIRYSAVTCDPDSFADKGFKLRQALYKPARQTELFIAITMYNEDEEFICRTLQGISENIEYLCKRQNCKTWGPDGWKKVVVCIIADGRKAANARALGVLSAMGVYHEDAMKPAKQDVTAHVFEYTTQACMTSSLQLQKAAVPVQFIFCLKEKNQKKINSHRWFFNAFAPILQPNICVLIDVGTRPGPMSIFHLWKVFDGNKVVGGACGELLVLKRGGKIKGLLNPLVAAQNFEYKTSNNLDKPFESLMGYISVLPGAFSAYRYVALRDEGGDRPLQEYFSGDRKIQPRQAHGCVGATCKDLIKANMFLAEDRILGWEIVSKPGAAWVLRYVSSAWAVTDVPEQVPELLYQRRRWINGGFFVALKSTSHFYRFWSTSHSFSRKVALHIGILYQAYNIVFSWFGLAHYIVAFLLLTGSLEDPSLGFKTMKYYNVVFTYFLLALLVTSFAASLGARPRGSRRIYTSVISGLAVVSLYMTVIACFLAVRAIKHVLEPFSRNSGHDISASELFANANFRNYVLSAPAALAVFIMASLVFGDPWHLFTSFFQALLFAPSNVAVLNLYAFANVHDVSWGTKGSNDMNSSVFDVHTSLSTEKLNENDGKKKESMHVTLEIKNQEPVNFEIESTSKSKESYLMPNADAAHDKAILLLEEPKIEKTDGKTQRATAQEDYYCGFRTKFLLTWAFTNIFLASVILWDSKWGSSSVVNSYATFILYSLAGQAFIRFIGSVTYQMIRLWPRDISLEKNCHSIKVFQRPHN